MSNSVRPHGLQPTRLLCPWDSPGKNTGVDCHFLPQCMKVESESEIAKSCLTLSDPMDCSLPDSSMGFSRQQYWSGVPLPSPTPCTYCPLIYDKGGKATQCQMDSLSTNDAVNTGQLNVTKMKLDKSLTTYTKISSKWIKDLNMR